MIEAFRALVEMSPAPMAIIDSDGRFVWINRAFAGMVREGADSDDLLDVEWATLLPDAACAELVGTILPTARRLGWEGEMRCLGGSDVGPMRVQMAPVTTSTSAEVLVAVTLSASNVGKVAAFVPLVSPVHPQATPILRVARRVIVVPVIGVLDERRSRSLMRAVLAGISAHRAKVVIMDLTGLPDADARAADHLARTVLAARLKGARMIVAGLSHTVAEAMVDIDVDWRGIDTVGDLSDGLVKALSYVGIGFRPVAKGNNGRDAQRHL